MNEREMNGTANSPKENGGNEEIRPQSLPPECNPSEPKEKPDKEEPMHPFPEQEPTPSEDSIR